MITIGSHVPEMDFEDTDGNILRLSEFRRTHSVLLYFMRSTSCPICNRHVRDLRARGREFEADNVRVLIAVPEDREAAAAWKSKHDIPFPVLVGSAGTPHETFGLTRKVFGSIQQSGTVLIDTDGHVRHVHGSTMPTASYDKKGIRDAI